MKKITTLVLSLGMLASTSAISYGIITPETKNSIYLPHDSWVIAELEKKIDPKYYTLTDDWKNKVFAGYTCVDSGASKTNKNGITSIVKTDRGVGLAIPLKKGEGRLMTDLYAGIIFWKPDEITDIVAAVSAPEPPTEGECYQVELYNAGANFETYDEKIAAMEKEQANVPETDFTFNAQTRMYQVNMNTYTDGYILEDDQGRKLFWCHKAINNFEKGKFYKLADVLNAYRDFKESMKRWHGTCGI